MDHACVSARSIFVTNFPDSTSSKDLWKLCQSYGTVVDVYIPNRRSKAGKRFAFVRFIKVDNVDRLVGNLCMLWIGRMHLHANVIRFECTPSQVPRPSQPVRKATHTGNTFAFVVKGNKKYFVTFIDDASRFCYVYLLHSKDEALDKFKVFKSEVELQQESLIKRFRTDRGCEYTDTLYFQLLKEMVNSMLSYSGLSQGFWGEAMLIACYLLNRVPNKRNMITPYELWTKKKPILNCLRVWGCRAAKRLPNPKLKTLGERGIECVFVGYAEHSKAFRKLKVDGTVEKFKARLVIQGFKQKSGIDYFDTYASVARISTIRLLIAMTSIHNLIIHQMDAKTTFLNEELEEEVYMNQPLGFIMSGSENKVDLTKDFLSSRFSMKDMGEADVIFSIRIKHESNGIAISQSHYIEKVLKKFNYSDCTLVSTPLDTCEKLMPNRAAGKEVEWLKNLFFEIPLWVKPIAPISIRCDSATTLAKAYRHMYNGKSKHLGVRHSMIRELITNGVVSIEFVRSQQNLADHLTKGLARDLVIKSAEGM
uniref:Zinc finger, CCHC-type n=1 Tax=Tanacetum cinerariifolium TaxID=118510 RepID=A0A6L2NA35_TANCI|nr:zinc finger, CCHC-type [Tanacetum cinerariifolium]